jgi:type VI secretion system protein VasD
MLRPDRLLHPIFWLVLVLVLTGCGKPQHIRILGQIDTASDVNPNDRGRPSPVVVRVYQLRTPGVFQTAEFFSLYDDEVSTLGRDLIAREEMVLEPNENLLYRREMDLETRYVGVIAAFRDLEDARWRSVVQLPEKKRKVPLRITLERLAVSVFVAK